MKKPSFILSFFLSICALIVFYLSYIIIFLILGGVLYILRDIPLISNLLGLLFIHRGDTPDIMLAIGVPALAYSVVCLLFKAVVKNQATANLSSRILGILLVLINVLSLVVNLIYGDSFLINIIIGIAGIAFIVKDFSE